MSLYYVVISTNPCKYITNEIPSCVSSYSRNIYNNTMIGLDEI